MSRMLLRRPALTFSIVSGMLNNVLAGPGWSVMLSLLISAQAPMNNTDQESDAHSGARGRTF